MTDPFSISLRAWLARDTTKDSVSYLISRINAQKGSFRNVTEAGLEEEIRLAEAGEVNTVEDGEEKQATDDGQDTQTKGDELFKAREEIIKQISAASRASSNALEFVSLLLSKHASKAAETTISPSIKAIIPMASIGAEVMQRPPPSEAERNAENLVGLGWRMQSLARNADSLLKSASRLEQEMEREATYWKEILAVKENGWSLCRLPGEGHTLGVRFGFGEAHPEFRDRGLAALRRNTNGNIELDRGPRWQGDKRLRVRLLDKGKILAVTEKPATSEDGEISLPETLLRARNSLLDEELYQELNREARNLIHHGVTCIGDTIRFPYQEKSDIRLDLVAVDDIQDIPNPNASEVPRAVLLALRILLSHAHRENLARRSKPPAPITNTSTPRPIYPLLRPIIEFLKHDSAVTATKALLTHLKTAFSAANIPFSTQPNTSSLTLPSPTSSSSSSNSTIKNLLSNLTTPHHALHTLHLPSAHTTLKLEINTSVFAPVFGTSYTLTTSSSIQPSGSPNPTSTLPPLPQTLSFPTLEKMKVHLYHILALDTINFLLQKQEIQKDWAKFDPYQAEIFRNKGKKGKVTVWVDDGGLGVEWSLNAGIGDGSGSGKRVWGSTRGEGGDGEVQEDAAENMVDVLSRNIL